MWDNDKLNCPSIDKQTLNSQSTFIIINHGLRMFNSEHQVDKPNRNTFLYHNMKNQELNTYNDNNLLAWK